MTIRFLLCLSLALASCKTDMAPSGLEDVTSPPPSSAPLLAAHKVALADKSMRLIDEFGADDTRSMDANVSPAAGKAFTARKAGTSGMILKGDEVVVAFQKIGWKWGGDWQNPIDYQHFSSNGL